MTKFTSHSLVLGALLVLITWLFYESRDPDHDARLQTREALRDFQIHDAELSRDVLMARAGLLHHYDALMQDRQNLLRDLRALAEANAQGTPAMLAVSGAPLSDLESATKEKLAMVEHFKSDNALTRNSLMYLTYSVAILDADAEMQKLRSVESAHLQHALLRFVETLDTDAGREIRAELDRLSKPVSHTSLPLLIAHGRLIVDVLPRVDAMLHEIINAPTTSHARTLEMALERSAASAESRAQQFRVALYFFSLVLLVYLVRQFTQLRAATQEVRASERRYRAITEFANEAIISTDSIGRIVSWNIGAQTIFGYTDHEAMGMPLSKIMPTALGDSQSQRFEQWVLRGAPVVGTEAVESIGLRKDGTEFSLELSRSSWSTEQGDFETGIIREITLRKALEARTRQQEMQLIQANKMTSLGLLVSNVAHEIGQNIQPLLNDAPELEESWMDALQMLDAYERMHGPFNLGGLPYGERRNDIATLTQSIRGSAQRIARISGSLKNYARPHHEVRCVEYHANDAVQNVVTLLKRLICARTSHFDIAFTEGLPPLLGNDGHVEQVLINLLVNALDALPEGDKSHAVSVSTRIDASHKHIVIEVRDQGKGIAPENLVHIFEPFFTTKASTGGTGLGLAISASLVKAQGGTLTFTSTVGVGTCAVLTLPLAPGSDA